jgi:hypothetical protein
MPYGLLQYGGTFPHYKSVQPRRNVLAEIEHWASQHVPCPQALFGMMELFMMDQRLDAYNTTIMAWMIETTKREKRPLSTGHDNRIWSSFR